MRPNLPHETERAVDELCGMLVVARLVELLTTAPEERALRESFSAHLYERMTTKARAEGKTDEEIESLTEGIVREVNMIRLNARSVN